MRAAARPVLLLVALAAGCGDEPPALDPVARVATQNAGTTPYLAVISPSEAFATCADWYDNNLCTLDTEAAVAATVAAAEPDVLFLQETWDQRKCAESDRPAAAQQAPYVCAAGEGPQLERVLPERYHYGCAAGYPDNCIVYDPVVFAPREPEACAGRDCSALVESLVGSCGPPGRIAVLEGETAEGAALLAVVHVAAGIAQDDVSCRAAQLAALEARLAAADPHPTVVIVAGDFNFDPDSDTGADADALASFVATAYLRRLPAEGAQHRLLAKRLDQVLARGLANVDDLACTGAFADADSAEPMLDHPYLSCR